jgi:hypothetical protein
METELVISLIKNVWQLIVDCYILFIVIDWHWTKLSK